MKRTKKKSKKKLIIILAIISILLIIRTTVIEWVINNSPDVFVTEYSGEYDIQYFSSSDTEKLLDYYGIDNNITYPYITNNTMTYSEYVEYFNILNLEITYSDENCDYMVYSLVTLGLENTYEVCLANVTYSDNMATLYIWTYGDIILIPSDISEGVVLVIPSTEAVNNIDIYDVEYTYSEISENYNAIFIITIIVSICIVNILYNIVIEVINKRKNKAYNKKIIIKSIITLFVLICVIVLLSFGIIIYNNAKITYGF